MTVTKTIEKKWLKQIKYALVGKVIEEVFYFPEKECKRIGWCKRPIVIQLNDGTQLYPMSDDEGNDGGAMATSVEQLPVIPVM